jgi:hypothetical protein
MPVQKSAGQMENISDQGLFQYSNLTATKSSTEGTAYRISRDHIGAPADHDGEGKADSAVFHPSNLT